MKKSLLALAVLGTLTGVASAQSSVTLFGIVDTNGRYVDNDGSDSRLSLGTDGVNSSRLGFRGIEDLGGGLRAGFWLEAGIQGDIGATTTAISPDATSLNQSKFFNRRSTVSLISPMGELRLGRDYVPTFWNQTIFDAFGTNGMGNSLNVRPLGVNSHVRQDNTIGYFLPANLGGFYGQAMVGAPEDGTSLDRPGKLYAGRLGFAAGPFDVAVSYQQLKFVRNATSASPSPALAGDTQDTWNVGGSFDFGFMKLMGYVQRDEFDEVDAEMTHYSISGVLPLGQSEIRLGYNRGEGELRGAEGTVEQIAATYQYNLSKRTAMYGTIAFLKNKDNTTRLSLPGGGAQNLGGDSKGFELGVRHIF